MGLGWFLWVEISQDLPVSLAFNEAIVTPPKFFDIVNFKELLEIFLIWLAIFVDLLAFLVFLVSMVAKQIFEDLIVGLVDADSIKSGGFTSLIAVVDELDKDMLIFIIRFLVDIESLGLFCVELFGFLSQS